MTAIKQLYGKIVGRNSIEIINGVKGAVGYKKRSIVSMDYDEYWSVRPDFSMQPRFPIIADAIVAGATVLDIGCGDGAMLAYLKRSMQITEMGIDISQKAVERATRKGVNARVQTLASLTSERVTASFDYVIMSEVIEHVENSEEYAHNAYNLASKYLILTIPNIAYFRHRLRLAMGRFPIQWGYHPGEHLRFWSVTDFRDWLAETLGNMPAQNARFIASNGITWLQLHRRWPNLWGNQIVVIIPKL